MNKNIAKNSINSSAKNYNDSALVGILGKAVYAVLYGTLQTPAGEFYPMILVQIRSDPLQYKKTFLSQMKNFFFDKFWCAQFRILGQGLFFLLFKGGLSSSDRKLP
jgi:hypothetical protein